MKLVCIEVCGLMPYERRERNSLLLLINTYKLFLYFTWKYFLNLDGSKLFVLRWNTDSPERCWLFGVLNPCRSLFWVWMTSVRTTWWTCRWWTCCRTGRASPGRVTTDWNPALNPPPSCQAFSHWCCCSACPLPLLQRWRCTPSGIWSPLGPAMGSGFSTTTDEMRFWPGLRLYK